MKEGPAHVRLVVPDTFLCLHCGTHYAMAMPIDVLAAAADAFGKEHRPHKLTAKGLACTSCFDFGHTIEVCPLVQYGGSLVKWLRGPDTGLSSKAICQVLTHTGGGEVDRYPLDPSDFGRCHRFLKEFPALRPRIVEMGSVSAVWARLADAWDELEALWLEESPSGMCPKLYARMKQLHVGRAPW